MLGNSVASCSPTMLSAMPHCAMLDIVLVNREGCRFRDSSALAACVCMEVGQQAWQSHRKDPQLGGKCGGAAFVAAHSSPPSRLFVSPFGWAVVGNGSRSIRVRDLEVRGRIDFLDSFSLNFQFRANLAVISDLPRRIHRPTATHSLLPLPCTCHPCLSVAVLCQRQAAHGRGVLPLPER